MKWTKDRLRTKFPAKVREERRAEGLEPDVRPTRDWLRTHGYSGIEGFARRNDMTVSEVLEEICGFEPPKQKPLGVRDPEARRLLEEWLEAEEEFFNQWDDDRVNDARTHIRTLAEVAYEQLGSTNLLQVVQAGAGDRPRSLMLLFSGLANRLGSQGGQSNYTRTLERWVEYLALIDEIEGHKVSDLREMMGYTFGRRSPEHSLEPSQVRSCWLQARGNLEYQALFTILGAAGNRRTEPTNITVDQLRLDRDDPYIVFDDDRKTGAATVPIMAGVEALKAWIAELETKEWWDGEWLFPSKKSKDGSRSAGWVNNVVEDLVTEAGVTFPDGEVPTPKDFRSFWYNHYMNARIEWISHVERAAEDQGVASAEIIDMHYLTNRPERDHFRRFAEAYFSAVFGEEAVHGSDAVATARESERDEIVQKAIDDFEGTVQAEFTDTDAETDESTPDSESPAALDPVSALVRTRLRVEHSAACASDTLEGYPLSPTRAGVLGVGLLAWSALAGVAWGLTGAFLIDPIGGDVAATPGATIGIVLGFALIARDLPDLDGIESNGLPGPELSVLPESRS
ncbi:hypothetical protein C463_11441 [Halorubrum californiense DSM 19288]|uniref:Tyr recombinase domain-containing protein n=1 Tax=Halorubrum californiense DSM 19288 TaxID=1227465 RepID=M0E2K9_9EURY|nr:MULTISPECIES: tyrosine-type recombinase/integrase [Halorubrum]ELZ42020.1 hypothetical protein C463_11441 [Halorubrum californiense DSM 19288]TKX66197.1 hypothetical protein EXE40_16025 [Halorubrum sp. GN11GM_10-3_MGM]